ncbi:hypothetical protein D3A96_02615 [Robertkochia marina]|nr:hypothetical protein D3A96_02615 [Robertkochia marina]
MSSFSLGALAAGLSVIPSPWSSVKAAVPKQTLYTPGSWLEKIKGPHKVVIDSPEVNAGNAIHWTENLYNSFEQENVPASEVTVVCVLRHFGIFLGMNTAVWAKYNLAEMAQLITPYGETLKENPMYEGNSELFGYEMRGIKGLIEQGAVFVICGLALEKGAGFIAEQNGMDKEEAKKDFMDSVFPGIEVVSSGVWAVARAQEQGCSFIYASK